MRRHTLRALSVLAALTLCCAPATASAQEGGGSEGGSAGGEIVPGAEGPLPNRGDIAVDDLVVTGDIVLDDESEILIGRDPGTGLRLDRNELSAPGFLIVRTHTPDGSEPGPLLFESRARFSQPVELEALSGEDIDADRIRTRALEVDESLALGGPLTADSLVVRARAAVGGDTHLGGDVTVEGALTAARVEADTLEVDRLVVAGREVASPRSDGTIRAVAGFARTTTSTGPSSSTHACMLTRFDSGGIAQCRVYVSRGRWRLRAGNAECEARCIRLR